MLIYLHVSFYKLFLLSLNSPQGEGRQQKRSLIPNRINVEKKNNPGSPVRIKFMRLYACTRFRVDLEEIFYFCIYGIREHLRLISETRNEDIR